MPRVLHSVAVLSAAALAMAAIAQPMVPNAPAKTPAAPPINPAAPSAPVMPKPAMPTSMPATIPTSGGATDPNAPPNPPIHPEAAALKFERVWYDFGKIPDTESVNCKFKFTNGSPDRTITIANIQTSCGCTTPGLVKKVYAPGESGEIDITFNPTGKHGLERKTISVYSDDKHGGEKLDLLIVSNIQQRVIIEPQSLFMGELPLRYTGSPTQELSITGRAKDFAITEISNSNAKYTVEKIGEDQVDMDGEKFNRYKYKVVLAPNLSFGLYQTNITMKTNDPVRPQVIVMATATVVGKIALNLDRIPIQYRQAGDSFAIDLYMNSRENPPKNFEILSVEATKPSDMVVVTDVLPQVVGTKNAYRIKIAGNVGASPVSGSIKIRTNVPDQEIIELPFVPMQIGQPKPMAQGAKPIEMTAEQAAKNGTPAKPAAPAAGH